MIYLQAFAEAQFTQCQEIAVRVWKLNFPDIFPLEDKSVLCTSADWAMRNQTVYF